MGKSQTETLPCWLSNLQGLRLSCEDQMFKLNKLLFTDLGTPWGCFSKFATNYFLYESLHPRGDDGALKF